MWVELRHLRDVQLRQSLEAEHGLFLADQAVKKASKKHEAKSAKAVKQAAVLGAGIMGGGIAYQSASKGTPIIMKDIASKALDLANIRFQLMCAPSPPCARLSQTDSQQQEAGGHNHLPPD